MDCGKAVKNLREKLIRLSSGLNNKTVINLQPVSSVWRRFDSSTSPSLDPFLSSPVVAHRGGRWKEVKHSRDLVDATRGRTSRCSDLWASPLLGNVGIHLLNYVQT